MDARQLEGYRRVFPLLDADGDSKLGIFDIKHLFATLGLTLSDAEVQEALTSLLDDVKEGNVEGERGPDVGVEELEFLKFITSRLSGDTAHEFKPLWRLLNPSGEASIRGKHLRRFLRQLGTEMSSDEANQMLSMFDRGGRDHIDFEELLRMLTS